jgi:hypothetical protein
MTFNCMQHYICNMYIWCKYMCLAIHTNSNVVAPYMQLSLQLHTINQSMTHVKKLDKLLTNMCHFFNALLC